MLAVLNTWRTIEKQKLSVEYRACKTVLCGGGGGRGSGKASTLPAVKVTHQWYLPDGSALRINIS